MNPLPKWDLQTRGQDMRMSSKRHVPAIVCLLLLPAALAQVPEPARVPVTWELKFEFRDPHRFTVLLPGDDHPTTFWYMLYRVENDTGQDVQFFPSAELVTLSLEVVSAGEQISPTVYDAIKSRHRTTHPFLVEPHRVAGPLLQGEDNARTSMVVFRDFSPQDNQFTIFFSGLSGEIQTVSNPTFDGGKPESKANPRSFTLRKTLQIRYQLPGDLQTRWTAEPIPIDRKWVMR